MRALLCLILLPLSVLPLRAQDHLYFPQFGDGSLAGLQVRTTLLFVNTGPAATVTVEFFDAQGQPLVISAEGISDSQRVIELQGGQGLSLQTSGEGSQQNPLALGYARIEAPDGVEASAVFSIRDLDSGVLLSESAVAAVRPLQSFTILFDSTGPLSTGLALVSTGEEEGLLSVTLRDSQSQEIAQRQVAVQPGQRISAFVPELLELEAGQADEMRGSLTVVSQAGPVAAITLRQLAEVSFPMGVPALTTFPVAPGAASQQAPPR
ncbi:MAG TPA: hypothetical protein VLU25_09425 [Acidobacteriota bacterium]|nr:hypothetical protein [Acidobacteriota bacterium]